MRDPALDQLPPKDMKQVREKWQTLWDDVRKGDQDPEGQGLSKSIGPDEVISSPPPIWSTPSPTATAATPGMSTRSTTRPSPTTTRPSGSTPRTPWPTTTAATPGTTRRSTTRPSPTTPRPSGSTPRTPRPTTTGATPGSTRRSTTRPSPTSTRPSGSIPRTPRPTTTAAAAWYEKKEYDKAIADFTEAIRLDPKDADCLQQPGQRLVRQEGVRQGHRRLHRGHPARSQRRQPPTTAATPGAEAGVRQGHRRLHRGHPARSQDADAYNNRGDAWSDKKEYDKAIADYTRRSGSTLRTPSLRQPRLALGDLSRRQYRDGKKAVESATQRAS